MSERMPWEDDELDEDDIAFLNLWENAGHDSEEHEALEIDAEGKGEVEGGVEIVNESDNKGDVEGDSDDPDSGESDEVDESKMDISQVEDNSDEWSDSEDDDSKSEPDHLESGDDAPDEIPEGESELEYDDLEDENDPDNPHDEAIDEILDAEEAEAQVEEEFGDGERADTDSEIEDLNEYEQEREEQELDADAEEDFEGDAQEELEDHLEAEKEQEKPKDEEKSDPEPLVEQPDENQEEGEEQHSGKFENLPEAGDLCTNHCEDNEAEESLDESCPHCTERIRAERELHGAIATDMHGKDILPGDRLLVRIPIGMIAKDSIVTANVPNMEVDPERLAITTVGKRDKERCWLAGKGVSNFTGWRMTGAGNAVWTFKKGHVITFAEKIAQPLFDELDPDKMMEDLADELDNYGKDNQKDDEDNGHDEEESDIDPEDEESESDSESDPDEDDQVEEPEDLEEHREKRERDELTSVQRKRFENLTERNWKKILNTFGSTIEAERLKDVEEVDGGKVMRRGGSIVSRGVVYTFGFAARKAAGSEIEEIEQWHKDREEDDAA